MGANRREAIQLYRDILRGCKRFHWADEDGAQWSHRLKESARREFEEAREEHVSLIIGDCGAVDDKHRGLKFELFLF